MRRGLGNSLSIPHHANDDNTVMMMTMIFSMRASLFFFFLYSFFSVPSVGAALWINSLFIYQSFPLSVPIYIHIYIFNILIVNAQNYFVAYLYEFFVAVTINPPKVKFNAAANFLIYNCTYIGTTDKSFASI